MNLYKIRPTEIMDLYKIHVLPKDRQWIYTKYNQQTGNGSTQNIINR